MAKTTGKPSFNSTGNFSKIISIFILVLGWNFYFLIGSPPDVFLFLFWCYCISHFLLYTIYVAMSCDYFWVIVDVNFNGRRGNFQDEMDNPFMIIIMIIIWDAFFVLFSRKIACR